MARSRPLSPVVLIVIPLAVLALGSCGSGDAGTANEDQALTGESVVNCLKSKGIKATVSEGGTYGTIAVEVRVPLKRSVGGEEATMSFFYDSAAASDYASQLTTQLEQYGQEADPGEFETVGNVVTHVPGTATRAEDAAIRQCAA